MCRERGVSLEIAIYAGSDCYESVKPYVHFYGPFMFVVLLLSLSFFSLLFSFLFFFLKESVLSGRSSPSIGREGAHGHGVNGTVAAVLTSDRAPGTSCCSRMNNTIFVPNYSSIDFFHKYDCSSYSKIVQNVVFFAVVCFINESS
jgi:hypothetical protein